MKIRKGIIISTISMLFMVLALTMKAVGKWEKTGLIVFAIILMTIGMVIETPLVKHLTEIREQEGSKSEPGWDGKRYD